MGKSLPKSPDRGPAGRTGFLESVIAHRIWNGSSNPFASLLEAGALVADSPRAPLRLGFPVTAAHRWLPGLFPDPPSGSR